MTNPDNATGPVVFRTKVDRWLVGIVLTSLGVGLWAVAGAMSSDPTAGIVPLAILLGGTLLVAALSLPTEYSLNETELVIRSGLLRRSIPLNAILRVYPTRNPLSAPAWSLDRLGIDFRVKGQRKLALISPARRSEFLELLRRSAELEVQGKQLVRRPQEGDSIEIEP